MNLSEAGVGSLPGVGQLRHALVSNNLSFADGKKASQ
jgi:hypothetical protein